MALCEFGNQTCPTLATAIVGPEVNGADAARQLKRLCARHAGEVLSENPDFISVPIDVRQCLVCGHSLERTDSIEFLDAPGGIQQVRCGDRLACLRHAEWVGMSRNDWIDQSHGTDAQQRKTQNDAWWNTNFPIEE